MTSSCSVCKGTSAALMYVATAKRRALLLRATGQSGDKYVRIGDGYHLRARDDDMMKVSAVVSPFERRRMMQHPRCWKRSDRQSRAEGLDKTKAFVC